MKVENLDVLERVRPCQELARCQERERRLPWPDLALKNRVDALAGIRDNINLDKKNGFHKTSLLLIQEDNALRSIPLPSQYWCSPLQAFG